MLIEFRCGNYSRFDKETGQYVICGQRMSAAVDDAGLMVSCPKCKKDCEVPDQKSKQESGKTKSAKAVPTKRKAKNPNRCPKCGGRVNKRGSCSGCGWEKARFSKANQTLDEMQMEPAGMMLWFSRIVSQAVPANVFCLAMLIAISFMLFALMGFALFAVGGIIGAFMFLMFLASTLLFGGMSYKGFQFLRDGNTELAWFQKPFWYSILTFCRMRNWQGLDSKLQNRNIVDLRGKDITDADLAQHDELKSANILDLEDTKITDAAIEMLYELKHLQCLVVRSTEASHLAVTRLQQSFPKLWIWH